MAVLVSCNTVITIAASSGLCSYSFKACVVSAHKIPRYKRPGISCRVELANASSDELERKRLQSYYYDGLMLAFCLTNAASTILRRRTISKETRVNFCPQASE